MNTKSSCFGSNILIAVYTSLMRLFTEFIVQLPQLEQVQTVGQLMLKIVDSRIE